jgi:hypothetical protein
MLSALGSGVGSLIGAALSEPRSWKKWKVGKLEGRNGCQVGGSGADRSRCGRGWLVAEGGGGGSGEGVNGLTGRWRCNQCADGLCTRRHAWIFQRAATQKTRLAGVPFLGSEMQNGSAFSHFAAGDDHNAQHTQ